MNSGGFSFQEDEPKSGGKDQPQSAPLQPEVSSSEPSSEPLASDFSTSSSGFDPSPVGFEPPLPPSSAAYSQSSPFDTPQSPYEPPLTQNRWVSPPGSDALGYGQPGQPPQYGSSPYGTPGYGPPQGYNPPQGYGPPQGYVPPGYGPPYPGGPGYGTAQGTTNPTLLIVLSIMGLLCCQILAPITWVLCNNALQTIGSEGAPESERSTVNVARIIAIIGCVIFVLRIIVIIARLSTR